MTHHDVPQNTPEWHALRLGRLTSTRAAAMLAKPRGKAAESVQRRDLRIQLALERITSTSLDNDYVSPWMKRGSDLEAEAIDQFEARTGEMAAPGGFVTWDNLGVGTSPDGLLGASEVLELKCPKPATHWRYLEEGGLPADYIAQVRHHLWVTRRTCYTFVSYCPAFPEPLNLFHHRGHVNEFDLKAYELAVRMFLKEVDDLEAEIRGRAA